MNSPFGKKVAQQTYIHVSCADCLDEAWQKKLSQAEHIAKVYRSNHYNVIRYEINTSLIALLNYPNFFEEPFPTLRESWRVNLATGELNHRTYEDSLNPPILHRKELLLPADHPQRSKYEAITKTAEAIGLFDEPARIGYQRQWQQWVQEKGYQIIGHTLLPLGNDESSQDEVVSLYADWSAARQLTALTRYGFSAPIQSLARYGFLDGHHTLFDYGCGHGDDVRGLVENGVQAAGWDPYYASDNPITKADVVNLGFVINVIEDFDERVDALVKAFSLAEQLLVVSVMLVNRNNAEGQRFRDGILTQRGTFQKYYSQAEIKDFIDTILDEESIPVAPGIFYVFQDKDAEQRFQVSRYQSRRSTYSASRLRMPEKQVKIRHGKTLEKYQQYREPLERLWMQWLSFGRQPEKTEVGDLITLMEGFGSLSRALRFIEGWKDQEALVRARNVRLADLKVYFALNQFDRRKPYKQLEPGLQRDIKAFFGDYANAQRLARALLFQIADIEAISNACREAAEHGLGYLIEGVSLQLHTRLIEQLPPLLRIYISCASLVYGDTCHTDLVKIHIASGKISLMKYDDFEGKPLPRMMERVKIKLREQDIEYYAYGVDYEPPFLYFKSRYINEEFPHYPEQVIFDRTLEECELFDFSSYGPRPKDFLGKLTRNRLTIEGFSLVRSQTIPNLDDSCGRYFTFRQFIECGETQAQTALPNLPKQPETYNAFYDLAVQILDPVIDYFGMIRLSYGFCSPELASKIPGRVDPSRDQHAGHELNRRGNLICERLGMAVDFVIDDESMLEVAQWIVTNTPFDRLYFYGDDKPVHVSFGPNNDKQIIQLISGKSGNLFPQMTSAEVFLSLKQV